MSTRQNILLNSASKGRITELNNDISLRFPNKLFYKSPQSIELLYFNLEYDITLFGNTNNQFNIVITDDLGIVTDYRVIVEYPPTINLDEDLAVLVTTALNSLPITNYTGMSFRCTNTAIENIVTNYQIEQEDYTNIFTITATRPCTWRFNVRDSVGPIMGFGNGIYTDTDIIEGTSTGSIESYKTIRSFNESGNDVSKFPNSNDLNCKMELYDSDNNLLVNITNPGQDVSISINNTVGNIVYTNIGQVLKTVEDAMNLHKNSFTPPANFLVIYDYEFGRVTIKNTTGAKFGIGFDFTTSSGVVTSGSLHKALGFLQQTYLGIVEITSIKRAISFENIFSEDYVLLCSDLVNNNSDINVIGIGNGDNIKSNNILFAIPITEVTSFKPIDSQYYRINIESSKFALGYRDNIFSDSNPSIVNFYLRLLSGRHIKSSTQWSALMSLNFV
jgi:hypothetical protein